MNTIPHEVEVLDSLAVALASRLPVFGRKSFGTPHRRISRLQLAKGRFIGGAKMFVIAAEGLVFTDLRVGRAKLG